MFLAGLNAGLVNGGITWTRSRGFWALLPVVCEAAVLDERLVLGKDVNVLTHLVFRRHAAERPDRLMVRNVAFRQPG